MQPSPQYDIILFHSNDDVDAVLKWFNRLYNTLTDQISFIEASLNSLKAEEDKDKTISDMVLANNIRNGVTDATNPSGEIPSLLVLTGFYTQDATSVPNHRVLLEELLVQRVRMLEMVNGARLKIQGLKASIMYGERPVLLVLEPIWYILGQKYLFSPADAQEYFCLKGECSTQAFPFVYYDPYFAFIGAGGANGDIGSAVDALP